MSNLNKKMDEMMGIKPIVEALETSVQHMSLKYDEILQAMKENSEKMKALEDEVGDLKAQVKEKDTVIMELQKKMIDTEMYARNRNIEISGIPANGNENLNEIMQNIAGCLDLQHNVCDIDIIHRVPSWNKKEHPKIVVQFTTRKKRNEWLLRKKHGITTHDVIRNSQADPIYINEHLTPYWKKLLADAKKTGKPKGYNLIWFKEGKILAKKNMADKTIIRILSEADFKKLT